MPYLTNNYFSRAGITEDGDDSPAAIEHAYRWILLRGGALSVVLFILWPLLTLPARVFSKGYWTFWVALSMAWGACKPAWSSKHFIPLQTPRVRMLC